MAAGPAITMCFIHSLILCIGLNSLSPPIRLTEFNNDTVLGKQ
jgi:hypothetical protein